MERHQLTRFLLPKVFSASVLTHREMWSGSATHFDVQMKFLAIVLVDLAYFAARSVQQGALSGEHRFVEQVVLANMPNWNR